MISGREVSTDVTVSREDYERAERFLPWNVEKLIHNAGGEPHWIGKTDRFWYRTRTERGDTFFTVNPETGTKEAAFDHERLAASLSGATGKDYRADSLPFVTFRYSENGSSVLFEVDGHAWECDLQTYTCQRAEKVGEAEPWEKLSPDGTSVAFVRDHNIFVRSIATGEERQLTHDGERDFAYGAHSDMQGPPVVTQRLLGVQPVPYLFWSPDSSKLATHKLDQRAVREGAVAQTAPSGYSTRPVVHTYRYALPGDEDVPLAHVVVLDLNTEQVVPIDHAPLLSGLKYGTDIPGLFWTPDSAHFAFLSQDRTFRKQQLVLANASTGACRNLIVEEGETYIYPGPTPVEAEQIRLVGNADKVIWYSTRDGWGHLYLHDGATGAVLAQITRGSWAVRSLVRIDEQAERVYFTAGGREPGRDPYYRHLYVSLFDGSDTVLLTPEDADHEISFSPSGTYFVDVYSRVDSPPTMVVRDAAGELVMELERADITHLLNTGWQVPERFVVKAEDGVTDLYGIILRPTTFDAGKSYPVVDNIYPGPQVTRVPKSFGAPSPLGFWEEQALAELGFVVVIIDGRGTPFRSKAFVDDAYGIGFGDAGGLRDHIAGLRQLADRYPYLDLDRVGIYGHSGGGFASARALFLYPDFFKVAFASSGNHDQRGFVWDWGERFIGPYDPALFEAVGNASVAAGLKGKLMLSYGEMDEGVHGSMTLQVADALVQANKDFDFLIVPNANHGLFDLRRGKDEWKSLLEGAGSRGNPYVIRRRWDYFVRHLLNAAPPESYEIGLQD